MKIFFFARSVSLNRVTRESITVSTNDPLADRSHNRMLLRVVLLRLFIRSFQRPSYHNRDSLGINGKQKQRQRNREIAFSGFIRD